MLLILIPVVVEKDVELVHKRKREVIDVPPHKVFFE
jgi:hypothetical protein